MTLKCCLNSCLKENRLETPKRSRINGSTIVWLKMGSKETTLGDSLVATQAWKFIFQWFG